MISMVGHLQSTRKLLRHITPSMGQRLHGPQQALRLKALSRRQVSLSLLPSQGYRLQPLQERLVPAQAALRLRQQSSMALSTTKTTVSTRLTLGGINISLSGAKGSRLERKRRLLGTLSM